MDFQIQKLIHCLANPTDDDETKRYVDENQDVTMQRINKKSDHFKRGNFRIFNGIKKQIKSLIGWDNEIDALIPMNNKVILMVGETGAGKSTTLNTFKNFLENVTYDNKFRYKLVDEQSIKSKVLESESQTQNVNIYSTNGYTFVDTPGFNATEGKCKDNKTIDDIKELLDSTLDYIDAICFVIKNSDNKATNSMKYVIDSVLGLFAKDVINNIFIVVTNYDLSKKKIPPIVSDHHILKTINNIRKKTFHINNAPYFELGSKGVYI